MTNSISMIPMGNTMSQALEAMDIIEKIKDGWSWTDLMVEYNTTIDSLQEAIDTCQSVSDEDRWLVKHHDCIINKVPKSLVLKEILKNKEYD